MSFLSSRARESEAWSVDFHRLMPGENGGRIGAWAAFAVVGPSALSLKGTLEPLNP